MDFKTWWWNFDDTKCETIGAIAQEAWNASRENMQEYGRHEFCRDVQCVYFKNDTCLEPLVQAEKSPYGCPATAKEFHCWLKENGYQIVKD